MLIIGQSACSLHKPAVDAPPDVKKIPGELPPDPIPRAEPRSRYGNPSSYVVFGRRYHTLASSHGFSERGIASWYGKKFHGRRTSSGEVYDMYGMTAAHKKLPLPTYVQVTNLKNGRKAVVRVNDRGPFHQNRVIDLSYSAARKLGILKEGTGLVEVQALDPMNYRLAKNSKQAAEQHTGITKTDYEGRSLDETVQESPSTLITSSPQVFVQVGAFGDRANASQLVNQLNGLNLGDVSITSVVKDAKELHRVRIGPISTVKLADDTVSKLNDMGMKEHRVVIE